MGKIPTAARALTPLRHRFGPPDGTPTSEISLGLQLLSGPITEVAFPDATPLEGSRLFRLWSSGTYLVGQAAIALTREVTGEHAANLIYTDLLERVGATHHLCRIWNYVPQINQTGNDGLEFYQSFCRGRSLVFESAWGRDFKLRLPAASAVGTTGNELLVFFAATTAPVTHFENPHQVPAYDYPCDYGPRPPSFARATVCTTAPDVCDVFISGTSAVRGHSSVAIGDTVAQTDCTLENLRDISRACGLGDHCGLENARTANVKIYLRQTEDCAKVEPLVRNAFPAVDPCIHVVRADVCRANLNIEIEVTARGVNLAG